MAKISAAVAVLGFALAPSAVRADPISKTVQLLSDLQSKVVKEGSAAQAEYAAFAEWCSDKHKDLSYEVKTATGQVAGLQATILKESSKIDALSTKIEEIVAGVASQQADLQAATKVRAEEAAAFAKEEKELVSIVDTLERAIRVMNKQAKSGSASMMQLARMPSILQAFDVMVQASVISTADAGRLTALVQSSAQNSEDDASQDSGAPAGAVYESHSGGVIDTLEGLLEKAEGQLDSLRKTETSSLHNFEMLQQSLQDEIAYGSKDLAASKTGVAASQEAKTVAEGDLKVTSKDLSEDTSELSDVQRSCESTAADFEAAVRSRDEELNALAEAKQALKDMTGGATARSYGLDQVSLFQFGSDGSHFAVVRFVRKLSRKEDSAELAQLANRIATTIRFNSRTGNDPFAKVKGLISDLITSLESAAATDSSHKAYCDKETAETSEKKDDKTAEVTKLSTAADKMTSRIAVLEEGVAQLNTDLASMAKAKASYDSWFNEAEAQFEATKADMEQGIDGVKLALKILRDYYAKDDKSHAAADGAAGGIVGLLETVESDFTKGLAETEAGFRNLKAIHEAFTRENELATTTKTQDVKYKGEEITKLRKSLTETTADRKSVQSELDAVMEYLAKVNEMCIEKAEPYEQKQRRREAELAGLREALSVLDGEAVLLQRGASANTARHPLLGAPHRA